MRKPDKSGYWWCICNDDHGEQIYLVDEDMLITDGTFIYDISEFRGCKWEMVRPPKERPSFEVEELHRELKRCAGIIAVPVFIENPSCNLYEHGTPMIEGAQAYIDFREGVVKGLPRQATIASVKHIAALIERYMPASPWGAYGA